MNNEIALYGQINDPMAAVATLGEAIAQSALYGMSSKGGGMVLAMEMLFTNLSPTQLLGKYHIVMNKLSLKADWIMGEFRTRGGTFKIITRTPDCAEVEMSYKGQTHTFRLTFDDIRKESFAYERDGKTLKHNYAGPFMRTKTLWARVTSDAVRTMAPEIVSGIPSDVEVESEVITSDIPKLSLPAQAVETAAIPPRTQVGAAEEKPISATSTAPKTDGGQGVGGNALGTVGQPAGVTAPPATEAIAPAASQPSAPLVSSGSKLTDEMVNQLENAIGGFAIDAVKWMKGNGKLKEGQTLYDLSLPFATSVITRTAKFEEAVKQWLKK